MPSETMYHQLFQNCRTSMPSPSPHPTKIKGNKENISQHPTEAAYSWQDMQIIFAKKKKKKNRETPANFKAFYPSILGRVQSITKRSREWVGENVESFWVPDISVYFSHRTRYRDLLKDLPFQWVIIAQGDDSRNF